MNVIKKTWRGQEIVVEDFGGGFRWNGTVYQSPTAVAKAITGAKSINGRAWLGLDAKAVGVVAGDAITHDAEILVVKEVRGTRAKTHRVDGSNGPTLDATGLDVTVRAAELDATISKRRRRSDPAPVATPALLRGRPDLTGRTVEVFWEGQRSGEVVRDYRSEITVQLRGPHGKHRIPITKVVGVYEGKKMISLAQFVAAGTKIGGAS